MIKYFFIFIIAVFLNAGEFDAKFNYFDKNFENSSLNTKKKLHKEIRDIYLKTSLKNNNKDKKNALNRLIYSSRNLGYNYKGYENELKALGGNYNNYLNLLQNNKPQDSKRQQDNKPKIIKKEIKNNQQKSNEVKHLQDKKVEKKVEEKTSTKEETSSNNKQLMLLNVDKIKNGIKLKFNREVETNEIKIFALSGHSYRNVIDFKALNYSKTNKIKNHIVEEIRVAQFNKNTSRVVFAQKAKFDINYAKDQNFIYITVGNAPKIIIKKPRTIVIDAGHGGKDPGAMANKIKEKDITLKVAKNLGKELENRGFKILYTRNTDKFIALRDRTAFANKKNADLFVSIHMNAGPNTKKGKELSGVETFFLSPARSERSKNAAALENKGDLDDMNFFSKQTYLNFLNREKIIASNKLAIDIQKHMLNRVQKNYNMKDGGVREAPFWVLVGATMPAILIECGYVTNSNDAKMLAKPQYQKDIAKGIAEGIDVYFSKNR